MLDRATLAGMPGDLLRALNELIEANGLDRDQVTDSDSYCNNIVHLEMFLHQYPRMVGIQLFPKLKSLSLINQVRRLCFPMSAKENMLPPLHAMPHNLAWSFHGFFPGRP